MEREQIKRKLEMTISNLRAKLLVESPFYGEALVRVCNWTLLTPEQVRAFDVYTAATDGIRMIFAPDYVERSSIAQLNFTILHEMYHILLLHASRFKQMGDSCNAKAWNYACDYVVNYLIEKATNDFKDFGLSISAPDGICLLRDDSGNLTNLDDTSVEDLYSVLCQNDDDQENSFGSSEGSDGSGSEDSESDGSGSEDGSGDEESEGSGSEDSESDGSGSEDGSEDGEDSEGSGSESEEDDSDSSSSGKGSEDGSGDEESEGSGSESEEDDSDGSGSEDGSEDEESDGSSAGGKGGSDLRPDLADKFDDDLPNNRNEIENEIKDILQDIASKGYSDTPGMIKRTTDLVLKKPKVRWDKFLRRFLSSKITDETTFVKPDRRYLCHGIIMAGPGGEEDTVNNLSFYLDTSGSISDSVMLSFLSHAWKVSSDFNCTLSVFLWNTKLYAEYRDIEPDDFKAVVSNVEPKSGGTSIKCVLDYIRENDLKSTAYIVLTDGYFSVPSLDKLGKRLARKTLLALIDTLDYDKQLDTLGKVVSIKEK